MQHRNKSQKSVTFETKLREKIAALIRSSITVR